MHQIQNSTNTRKAVSKNGETDSALTRGNSEKRRRLNKTCLRRENQEQNTILVSARSSSHGCSSGGVRRDPIDGDLTCACGFSGMNSATINARITRIAPNANGGPGIIPCTQTHTCTVSRLLVHTLYHTAANRHHTPTHTHTHKTI